MKKDAYYFPHFCNARSDRKIKRLKKDLGIEGYGIYFMTLEVLRDQTDFKYPISDVDLLADEFGTSEAKLQAVISKYELFELDLENNFFSPKLMLYLQPYIEKSERARLAAKKRWNNVNNKSNPNAYANALLEHCESESKCNAIQNASKVKESKVKESKVKESKVKESRSSKEEKEKQPTTTATENINPIKTYQKNIGLITPHIAERMNALIKDGITEDLISKYIEVATERNKRTWAYVEKMAQGNLENNIKTVEQYTAYCIERANSYKTGGSENGGNQQNTGSQYEIDSRTMSEEELAEKYKWAGMVL